MSSSDWLEKGRIKRQAADRAEIQRLLAVVDRDLADASDLMVRPMVSLVQGHIWHIVSLRQGHITKTSTSKAASFTSCPHGLGC